MTQLGKITRILLKTIGFSVLFIVIIINVLYLLAQTSSFQTWAAKKATEFLSNELGTKISIDKVKISLISNVSLNGVFVSDTHGDTLLYGKSISVGVSSLNIKLKSLNLKETRLDDIKIKLLKYKNEEDWNFQFLADYFSSSDSLPDDTTAFDWKIKYGTLKLSNVDFTYRLLRDTFPINENMNYNFIHVSNIYGKFSEFRFNADTICARIENLKAKEQCGIELLNLNTYARISSTELKCDSIQLKTKNSYVLGQLQFKYNTWEDYIDFIDKVYIKGHLKDSTSVSFKDIAYFAEDLNGLHETVNIKGNVRGFVNDLSCSDIVLNYKKNTQFVGDVSISGLPDIQTSYIHFDAKKLSTSKEDVENIPLPPFNKPQFVSLPPEISKLGVVSYKGKFDGFFNNFATYGLFKSDIGNLKTDIQIINDEKTKQISYSGKIETNNLYLSKLFPSAGLLKEISASGKIKGKGFTQKDLDAKFEGVVNAITFNDYTYKNILVEGEFKKQIFNGFVESNDPNANFDFNGSIDFNHETPKMDFISTVINFDLNKTNFSTSKLNGAISSQILIDLKGNSIDNMSGLINFDNTNYKANNKVYKLSSFNLELNQESVEKNILLNSSIANVELKGKYNLSTLPNAFIQYLNDYFPTFIKRKEKFIYRDKADLTVRIKNYSIVNEIFTKEVMFSQNTTLYASFDASINFLFINTLSDEIVFSGTKFKKNVFQINSLPQGVSLQLNSKSINVSDSLSFKNTSFKVNSNNTTSTFNLLWDNAIKPTNSGLISGNVNFDDTRATLVFDKVNFTIEDSLWQIVKSNPITIDTSLAISFSNLTFYNHNQLITLDGKLSKNVSDKFDVFVQNFRLSQLNPFLKSVNSHMEGSVTGNTSVYAGFGKSLINSEITFKDFKFNNRLIGYGEINSEYNPEKEYVRVNGFSAFLKDAEGNNMKNIEFQGFYFPKKETENIDLTFKTEPFDLALLQPLLKDILTIKMGFLTGSGKVTGSINDPKINAKLKFFKCIALIDYTNVAYSVSGNVEILPNQIRFDNIEMRDIPTKGLNTGNVAFVSGNIFHNNFKDMRIDFDLNTNKLLMLNTSSANNPSYYGTAYAGGNIGLYGFLDGIKMELNLKTFGGTYVYIPLDGPSEVGNNDFIKFVTKDTVKIAQTKTTSSNFSIDFNLEATKDAEVQLIFDEKSGDIIKARGDGNLSMKINSKGKFDMVGDYVLSTGDYMFTLENFVTKKFEIQKGSSIKWSGSVYKANIDIVANYKQRASIKPLFPNDSINNYNKRFPVDCKLYMKDKLTSPDIKFGIELPTIDENTRSAIKSLLSDENELNRQLFSLLLLRSFVTPLSVTGGSGISAGNAAAATGSEMLSNKMSNWLNGVTKDMDIGVNYRPGGTLSSDELDLALSKQLFNNRLVIDGNFGVANNSSSSKSTIQKSNNSSNLIGDVSLEYKLSESGKYRIKAFNRSNDNTESATSGGPFTQGVGIFYREEYENLSELYKRYISKVKKK